MPTPPASSRGTAAFLASTSPATTRFSSFVSADDPSARNAQGLVATRVPPLCVRACCSRGARSVGAPDLHDLAAHPLLLLQLDAREIMGRRRCAGAATQSAVSLGGDPLRSGDFALVAERPPARHLDLRAGGRHARALAQEESTRHRPPRAGAASAALCSRPVCA
eukprot:1647829-Prymnesium_polylepis.2